MSEQFLDRLDIMIKEAWNDENYFCRKLKDYLGRYFSDIPEIKERCKDPYWKDLEEADLKEGVEQ